MGVKISDATPKGSSDGTELIGVSDSLSAKSISAANIKDYTIDQIEAIGAGNTPTDADSVFILQDAGLKPVDIDLIAQHAIDIIWAKAAEATPIGADVMALKDDGDVEKTVTLTVLAEYIRSAIEGDILDISDLGTGTPADADFLLLCQGSVGKKVTYLALTTAIYAALDTYVNALAAVTVSAPTDVFYVIQGGQEKKVTLAEIATYLGGGVTGPGSTTEDNIPQWSAVTDDLKDGLTLVTGSFGGAGASTAIATTQAIESTLASLIYDETVMGTAILDADLILMNDGGGSAVQRKTTFTAVWTWIVSKLTAVTDVSTYSWVLDEDAMGSDSATKVATQQSIKKYVDDSAWDGDITDIDLDGGSEISADLVDADLILVDDGGVGTNKSSLVSRIWTYIQGKLAALYVAPGTGISAGSSTVCVINTEPNGTLFKTTILLDLTDLHSTAADDIIGVDGTSNPCYITQVTVPLSGTIILGKITCIEAPVGGDPDIDLYAATEGTGSEDDPISGLTETILINHGDWTALDEAFITDYPTADQYLYLVAGDTTDADYTAGIFLIELWGE